MHFWLYKKFIFQKKLLSEPTAIFALAGIALGVAFLVVLMAGFGGFSQSLKRAIIDLTGDVQIYRRGGTVKDKHHLLKEINKATDQVAVAIPFVQEGGLVANQGKLSAVVFQGIDLVNSQARSHLLKRVIPSEFTGTPAPGEPAYVGKVVAQNLKLKVGDGFKAIIPKVSKGSATKVSTSLQNYYVEGILDFGKYEFNERFVVSDLEVLQNFANIKGRINGYRINLKDSAKASAVSEKIQQHLGWDYSVRPWTMRSRSLFKAIRYEKTVLFFVMLVMVVAAFFNVATTLFLGVLRRYAQVSVMRALGLKKRDIVVLFCFHGMFLGVTGLLLGLILGYILCVLFENFQKIYPIMPEDVYKMSNFSTHLESQDLVWVVVATLVICFLSTLAPAFRGARLSPVEGLKYE